MLRALVAIGALQLATMVLMLARTKALALLLGPENVGLLAIVDKLVAVVAQTASLSLPFAALRFLPPMWTSDREGFDTLYGGMRNTLLLLSVLAGAGGAWVSLTHPAWWGPAYVELAIPLALAFATVPVLALVPFIQSVIAARLRQNQAMGFSLAHAAVAAVAGVGGAWVAGLRGLYAGYGVAGLLLVIVALRLVRTDGGGRTSAPLQLPRRVWRFSSALLLLTFAAPYAALYVHYEVLRHYGAETAGWMQASLGLALAVRACLGAAHGMFLTPNVNRGGTPEERMRWVNLFQRNLSLLMIAAVPLLVLFPDVAVRLLYSEAFGPAASFVALFVAAEVLAMLAGSYQSLIIAHDRLGFHVAQNLVAQLLMLGTGALLVPRLGIAGAGVAALVTPLFLYVSTAAFLSRTLGLRIPAEVSLLATGVLVALLAAGVAGVQLPGLGWKTVVAKMALYATIAVAVLCCLTRDERGQVRRTLASSIGRLRPARAL